MDKQFFNIKEVATLMDCSPDTIRRKVKLGQFPPPVPRNSQYEPLKWQIAIVDSFLRLDDRTFEVVKHETVVRTLIRQELKLELARLGITHHGISVKP